ncbi:hypothetical protein ACJX0J_014348 [Zea mays]
MIMMMGQPINVKKCWIWTDLLAAGYSLHKKTQISGDQSQLGLVLDITNLVLVSKTMVRLLSKKCFLHLGLGAAAVAFAWRGRVVRLLYSYFKKIVFFSIFFTSHNDLLQLTIIFISHN